ncbi:nitrile hydratase accessory protein [Pseudomonas syringae group genomosp. 3]|uniref:nitrile hydratase accessory protein n=1 Tax=Pseudomonas syringae group genomosp. 3 TaxID=251701 RepID=UPI0005C7F3A3|nr:nitrile hydratase accessory protein [Pseudomonas syringae group genomosp. 3]
MIKTSRSDYETVGLPLDAEGPVFEHPWQAQAFSLVVHLHQAGRFPWADWVRIFSDRIKTAPAQPGESANDAYYRQWCAAMETLVEYLGLCGQDAIAQRAEQWCQAYLNTPHGEPVNLVNATCPPTHAHHHPPRRAPIKVSPAG